MPPILVAYIEGERRGMEVLKRGNNNRCVPLPPDPLPLVSSLPAPPCQLSAPTTDFPGIKSSKKVFVAWPPSLTDWY